MLFQIETSLDAHSYFDFISNCGSFFAEVASASTQSSIPGLSSIPSCEAVSPLAPRRTCTAQQRTIDSVSGASVDGDRTHTRQGWKSTKTDCLALTLMKTNHSFWQNAIF